MHWDNPWQRKFFCFFVNNAIELFRRRNFTTKMSRFGEESILEIEQKITEAIPKNTASNHDYIWRQFMCFCKEKGHVLDENTNVSKLADILKYWAFNMKKQNGEDYKDYTVKTIWNVTAKLLMNKYHRDYNIIFNPFSDIQFKSSRDAKNAKRKQLQQEPEKRKQSSVFLKHDEFIKIVETCDEETPDGLQKKMFFVLSYELVWRGGEGPRCLTNYLKEELDHAGQKTGRIEYNPLFTKTTQGGDKPCASSKWLVRNKVNPNICPIRLYKKFMQKRQAIKCERLFLTVNPFWQSGKWYKSIPVGRNLMNKWTSTQAEKSGLTNKNIKLTNHSLRATAVSKLAKKGVGEQQLIKLSGHSNTKSLTPYIQMDENHHRLLIEKMRNNDQPSSSRESPAEISSRSLTASTTMSTNSKQNIVNYNNCTFHCNSCYF